MPSKCEIEFDKNSSKEFQTGQLIRGNVHLHLTEAKSVCGIYIRFVGKANVLWNEGTGPNRKCYSGKEKHLNELIYLVGGEKSNLFKKKINLQ